MKGDLEGVHHSLQWRYLMNWQSQLSFLSTPHLLTLWTSAISNISLSFIALLSFIMSVLFHNWIEQTVKLILNSYQLKPATLSSVSKANFEPSTENILWSISHNPHWTEIFMMSASGSSVKSSSESMSSAEIAAIAGVQHLSRTSLTQSLSLKLPQISYEQQVSLEQVRANEVREWARSELNDLRLREEQGNSDKKSPRKKCIRWAAQLITWVNQNQSKNYAETAEKNSELSYETQLLISRAQMSLRVITIS